MICFSRISSQVFGSTKILLLLLFCIFGFLPLTAHWGSWLLDYSKRQHVPQRVESTSVPYHELQTPTRKLVGASLSLTPTSSGLGTQPILQWRPGKPFTFMKYSQDYLPPITLIHNAYQSSNIPVSLMLQSLFHCPHVDLQGLTELTGKEAPHECSLLMFPQDQRLH